MAVVFTADERCWRNLVEWAAGMSTGRAQEMQKGGVQFRVSSSQFSVLSSQFSVLSSQFSVLSSQFSVEGSLMRKVAFGVVVFLSLVSSLLGQIAGTKVVALRCGNLFDGRGDSLRRNRSE